MSDNDKLLSVVEFNASNHRINRLTALLVSIELHCMDGGSYGLNPVLELVDSVQDHEGMLIVWWNIPDPPDYYKKQFASAWESLNEVGENVEHLYSSSLK